MSAPRTRALFKKGQKVIKWESNPDPDAPDKVIYKPASIQRGEKRTDPLTKESGYFYHLQYLIDDVKHKEEWVEEKDLIKYDIDLLTGTQTEAADAARRRIEDELDYKKEIEFLSKIPSHLRLRMPYQLKKILLDDYEQITIQGKHLPLPRTAHGYPSVEDIINEWKNRDVEGQDEEDIIEESEVATGLTSYFNNAVRHFLLYQSEITTYDTMLNTTTPLRPSQVYGAEHLVRLFVKLPELISVMLMAHTDATNIVAFEGQLHDLMKMMVDTAIHNRIFASSEKYISNPHWSPPLNPPVALSLLQPVNAPPPGSKGTALLESGVKADDSKNIVDGGVV